ncbi:MAG: hypothetical protein ACI85O_000290 [Saprospiraceae bacterium]|jgi:hypothetical protein
MFKKDIIKKVVAGLFELAVNNTKEKELLF